MNIDKIIAQKLVKHQDIWVGPEGKNYWSNLNIDENKSFLEKAESLGTKQAVEKSFPEYSDVIFSPKRAGGLIFVNPKPDEVILDCGCMWGALTIPLARSGCSVIAIDQTLESLQFLKQRILEENLTNVELVCSGLNMIDYNEASFDKAIVNGVLEWLPEKGKIELKRHFGKRMATNDKGNENPYKIQLKFLRKIHKGLKNDGKLYLAIENRFDIFHFLGMPDPHCNLKFITFMPRYLQNLISNIFLGRAYRNWIYSPKALKKMFMTAGFKNIEVLYAFPDYRFPKYIFKINKINAYLPYRFQKVRNIIKKFICYCIEVVFFRILRLYTFSPSLIVLAEK